MSGVLLFGLDGLHWGVLDDMAEFGAVPTINELRATAPSGVCRSTIPSLTCPALPTMYTGMNPGNFGIFDFIKPDGSITNLTDIDVPKIWDYLDEEGKRSLIAGMRTTHPAPDINGAFISGVLSPEDEPHFVSPEEFRPQAERFNDAYPNISSHINNDDRAKIAELLKGYTSTQTDVFLELFDELAPIDFGLFWLSPTDSAQHHLWGHDELLAEVFATVDNSVARVLEKAEENDFDVLFVSDHGFGQTADHVFHTNEWLYRQGYLSMTGGRLGKPFVDLAYRIAEAYLTDQIKRRILDVVKSLPALRGTGDEPVPSSSSVVITPLDSLPGIDWNRTEAHLSTRKGWGITLKGDSLNAETPRVRDEIINRLRSEKTPDGSPLVKNAWPGEQIYFGKFADQIPDIVVLYHDSVRARPSITGTVFSPRQPGKSLGSHMSAREGIVMATGPRITDRANRIDDIDLYDILPTVLHLMGMAIPTNLDGTVIHDLYQQGSTAANRDVAYREYDIESKQRSGEFGQGDGVKRRLEDLGYL